MDAITPTQGRASVDGQTAATAVPTSAAGARSTVVPESKPSESTSTPSLRPEIFSAVVDADPQRTTADPASSPEITCETTPDVLLHVGYHKTGTTWLQQAVFAEHGGEGPFMRPWKNMVIDELVTPHPLHFDADAVRKRFHAGLLQAREAGKVPLISAERLSGNPHSGGYDAGEIAHRLAAVFPQARVLMVVREQTRAILSGYRQYVMVGGACSLPKYLTAPQAGRARVPWFCFEQFEYDRLLAVYQKLFGPSNVLVLTHEELCSDPDAFVARIINHAGIEPPRKHDVDRRRRNASVSDFVLNLKRPVNRIFVRDGVNPGGLIDSQRFSRRLQRLTRMIDSFVPNRVRRSGDERARTIVREAVGDRYRASNRRLAEMINRDLAAEGYMM